MTIKTILLPVEKAAFVQKNAAEYGCNLVELAVAGNNSAKVTVTGEDDNVKKLFDEIGE
ncbi:MAG: hypothetical protein IKL37_00110 [Alphaproteobacteria bacterium]|jgi:hypothetical protein|nr:hypothetical protein [Alphaproteobacteria bacterium]MBR6684650.1 hypothetical protein [Alphaproteobacteria bacterium]